MATQGTISANGDTDKVFARGPTLFKANGTWGGGTFVVKIRSKDGTTYKELETDTAMTSDSTGEILFDLPGDSLYVLVGTLSGATSPSLAWEFFGDVQEAPNE